MALNTIQKNLQEAKEEAKNREMQTNLSPKEKLEIAENTIKEFNSNRPLVKEAIKTDLTIKAYNEDINEFLLEKERRKQQSQEIPTTTIATDTNTATKDSSNSKDSSDSKDTQKDAQKEENRFASLTDEELEEKINELKEQRENEQDHLKQLITEFEPKDIAELLQQLYKMDTALAELISTNQDLKLAESERKMRALEELLQRDKIQALTQIISDISDKYIQLQGERANILESKKEYEALNQLMEKNEKPEIIKDKMEKINQKFPHFTKDYPNTTKRAQEYIKQEHKEPQKQQESQGRSL